MPAYVEIFNRIKPTIEFGLSLLTLKTENVSMLSRYMVYMTIGSMTLNCISTSVHIVRSFQGEISTNFILSTMGLVGIAQPLLKTLVIRPHRRRLYEILNWAEALHHEEISDPQLRSITQDCLTKFSEIWITIYKIGIASYILTTLGLSGTNYIRGREGIILAFPFIPDDYAYCTEIVLTVQLIAISFACAGNLYNDLSIMFVGFEIMAALDILNDYIEANKDCIQANANFLKAITIRYWDVISHLKMLNTTIYMMSLMQFSMSTFMTMTILLYIRMNPAKMDGYIMVMVILSQPFCLCFYGEFFRIKTDRLSTSLYLTNWYDLSLKEQKCYSIVLAMAQRPYGMKAAGLYQINMRTFIEIMKMAISYCAILYTFSSN
ncbi:odorant receptor 94b-like [Phlebotomus argentipes]|uniref:odorant receptor 94b-like n=1 Tax=Phlebotomus argentipes TaxID=94469 RepID=UPI002892EA86|nr:odorant receptor 94b-like [Phlebotomus argentipes]